MSVVRPGVLLGLIIGSVDVALMLPLSFPDKRAPGRFLGAVRAGVLRSDVRLPISPTLTGLLVGILTSLPDAIITKAYVPIMAAGAVFGAIAGATVGRWAV